MAEVFESYKNARIDRITQGARRGISIVLFTDEQIAKELSARQAWGSVDVTINNRGIMTGPLRLESLHVGDETKANIGGDATNVAIGQRASAKAGDINVFKQGVDQSLGLDPDLKQRFKEARETIEASGVPQKDKDDAAARLGDLKGELEQPNPDKGRIRRCLEWLKDIVPSAAEILSSAAKIGELFRG